MPDMLENLEGDLPSGHSVSARPRKAKDIVFIFALFDTLR